jgi:uncharacterized phage protein (TIGR01671 family)
MKDRYLFRGIDTVKGEWITGHLTSSEIDGVIKIFHEDEESSTLIQVMEETIGQCTGLKDKNGELIFEGDILLGKADSQGVQSNHFIEWCEDGSCFGCSILPKSMYMNKMRLDRSWIAECEKEIVGNIHES